MSGKTIGIVLFGDAEELDWAGPWEVFTMASQVLERRGERLSVVTIAERPGPVRCAKGLRVLPDHDFASAPKLDMVLVPGGQGTRVEMDNAAMVDWLARVAAGCEWVTSVCTGSILLCRAGLAQGCRVTTHWGYIGELRKLAPEAEVLENVRYVQDGRLVTAAGVSAGIDMALWLVGELYGEELGRLTQRLMEYDPQPPWAFA